MIVVVNEIVGLLIFACWGMIILVSITICLFRKFKIMRYTFLVIVAVSGFIAPIFGSEKSNEICNFDANLGRLNYNPLRYCDKKYIDFLNNTYDMQCGYNEPFLRIYYPWTPGIKDRWVSKEEQDLRELVEPITFVPYRYFMNDNTDPQHAINFKQPNKVLLFFSKIVRNEKKQIQITLNSDFENMDPKILLDQFRTEIVQCMPGHIFNEKGNLLSFVDTTELEKELCDAGIILLIGHGYKDDKPQYEQWVNGYFGDEIKAEIKEKVALFYSRLKKLFFGGSIAAILMYVLYQKFYATAEINNI